MKLTLCAAVVSILWFRRPGGFRAALVVLAAAAVASYTSLFQFHGDRSWAHLHDVAHYYLGAKYYEEVGYSNLYVALLRAESEEYGNSLTPVARDLRGNFLVPVGRLLEASDAIKERFTAERWSAFRRDMRFFRETMG